MKVLVEDWLDRDGLIGVNRWLMGQLCWKLVPVSEIVLTEGGATG